MSWLGFFYGGNITGAALSANIAAQGSVQIQTATQGTAGGNGDIFVNDNVTWTSGNTLTLAAERRIGERAAEESRPAEQQQPHASAASPSSRRSTSSRSS